MSIYLYVDNSNVFIEGKRTSAVEKGYAPNIYDAMNQRILDQGWRLDFGNLHRLVSSTIDDQIVKASLFGSRPPQNDSVWQTAKQNGFTTVIFDRNSANKEKKVDTGIITEMIKDAYTIIKPKEDKVVLVAGDSDFVPAIESLQQAGIDTYVFFWEHASMELQTVIGKNFVELNTHLTALGH